MGVYKKGELVENTEVSKRVQEHEFTLRELKNLIGTMGNSVTTLTIDVKTLSKSVGKQEIILEKMSSMDEKYNSSIDRLHKRVDEVVKENQGLRDELQKVNEARVATETKLADVLVIKNRLMLGVALLFLGAVGNLVFK